MIKIINSLCNFCNEYLFQYAKQKLLLWKRGFILSSFYIGYILTQIIGGMLSDKIGAFVSSLVYYLLASK